MYLRCVRQRHLVFRGASGNVYHVSHVSEAGEATSSPLFAHSLFSLFG
jgi:hypothetical protein